MLASAPSWLSEKSQFFRLCSIEHNRKNWVIIDTISGVKASAIAYSIAETAKANNLKTYEYFKYLLTVFPEHLDKSDRSFMDKLLPWSGELPSECRKPVK